MNLLFSKQLLGLVLLGAPGSQHACSYPDPPSFFEALEAAESVAIVRVEEIRLKEKGPQDLVFHPDMDADVRVAETLLREPASVRTISFSSSWCGGHKLNVGDYYVLLIRSNDASIDLLPGDPAIVSLFGEYEEQLGSKQSRSRLLMHLRNYGSLRVFPETFPIREWIEAGSVRRVVPPSP